MPLDDNTFGLVIAAMDTEIVDTFLRRVAVEELGVDAAELDGRASEIAEKAYWSWGKAPLKQWLDESGDSHFSMDLLKLDLWTTLFPSVARPTTTSPTTTTTTTTRRRWHFITTARTTAAPVNAGAMPPACACSDTIVASRRGCKAHLGMQFGSFCYIQGGTECAGYGRVRYSRSKRAHYRMCEP